MGRWDGVKKGLEQAVTDFQDDAEDAKRKADEAAAEAKRKADDAAAEAQRVADAAAAKAQQETDAAAAEARRQADRAATEARRVTDAAITEARRKIDAANQVFHHTLAQLQTQVDRAARTARNEVSDFIATATSRPNVRDWLSAHPSVAAQIVWQTTADIPLAYPLWNPSMKSDLERAFNRAWDLDSIMPTEPVSNKKNLGDDDYVVQFLDHADAWKMFVAYVAQSLAVEIGRRVQWSIIGYSLTGLTQLFHSSEMFTWRVTSQAYEIEEVKGGSVLPCSPEMASSFLFNGIVDTVSRSTIANLLDWCRSNLIHFSKDFHTSNVYDQWQYRGFPPVSSMLSGTPKNSDPAEGIRHRTAGCSGTVGFLKAILRTVNIPVKLVMHASHAQPYFVEDDLYLSHGDDPYSMTIAIPPMPISELLVDRAQFEEWFGKPGHRVNEKTQAKNIGRRPRDLSIQYLPNRLLTFYCEDQAQGKTHADGEVYEALSPTRTVAELEGLNLWSRMDEKIAALGGCASIPDP